MATSKSIFATKPDEKAAAKAVVRKNPVTKPDEEVVTARSTRPGNAAPAAKVKAAPKTKAPAKSAISAETAKKLAAVKKTTTSVKTVDAAPAKTGKTAPVTKLPPQKTVLKNPAGTSGARAGAATVLAEKKKPKAEKVKAEGAGRGRRSTMDMDSKVALGNKKAEDSGLRGGRLERLQAIHDAHRKNITLGELLEATGLTTGNAKVFVESGAITLS